MWASKTYTFSPSTTVRSAEVNTNFDDLVDGLNTAMPSGSILIWSGSVASIPTGWYLCNGSNGTPDLRGKFVYGAGGSYNPGDTGGEETHTLTESEMPVHKHLMHGNSNSGSTPDAIHAGLTALNRDLSGYTDNAGSGAAHNNLPPYHALAYIQKS